MTDNYRYVDLYYKYMIHRPCTSITLIQYHTQGNW